MNTFTKSLAWIAGIAIYFVAFFAFFKESATEAAGEINGFGFTLALAVCGLAVAAPVLLLALEKIAEPTKVVSEPAVSLTK